MHTDLPWLLISIIIKETSTLKAGGGGPCACSSCSARKNKKKMGESEKRIMSIE